MRNSSTSKRPFCSTTVSKMFSMIWESIRWPSASTTSWSDIESSIVPSAVPPRAGYNGGLRLSFLSLFLLAFPAVAQQPSAPQPAPRQAPAAQHETVVVTGTFEPLSLDEMDRAITLLPARSNGLALNALVDLLRADPALDLQERAPNGVQTDLSIRGGTFAQTLVLFDGQRLSDAQTGHHDMDIPVPLDAIEQVEVLRGSGSTLYGSDAIGGVINIITAPPEDMELRLRTAVGNDGINQQRASDLRHFRTG